MAKNQENPMDSMMVDGPSDELVEMLREISKLPDPRPKTPQLVTPPPPRYDGPDPKKTGDWRAIRSEGVDVGVMWTDSEDGFGIIVRQDTEATEQLRGVASLCKQAKIPALWAYNVVADRMGTTYPGLELGPPQQGKLSGIYDRGEASPTNTKEPDASQA